MMAQISGFEILKHRVFSAIRA